MQCNDSKRRTNHIWSPLDTTEALFAAFNSAGAFLMDSMVLDRRPDPGRKERHLAAHRDQGGGRVATLERTVHLLGRALRLAPE